MTYKYINWDKDITIAGKYFPADRLDRAKYADFLTKMLVSHGYTTKKTEVKEQKNYVLNLNSEWGSGKTFFLKRWEDNLKNHFPVVYIDSWKQDYSEDPLMTVVSSIITQLRQQAGKDEDDPLFKTPRKLIGLLKAAAPGLARGLFKRYLGIDPVKIMQGESDDELPQESIDTGFAASEVVKYLLDEHAAKQIAIDDLKENVKTWVSAVIGLNSRNLDYPAFIFIDELDRCRPNYAVEMLETIKHIFNIEGVVFVIATDTEQLQHTIKSLYGTGFDARSYLGRFFNSRYTLKEPKYESLLEAHCDIEKLSINYFNKKRISVWPENGFENKDGGNLYNLVTMYEAMGLSARQVIQITDRLIATIDNLNDCQILNVIYLSFLLCLREQYPHIFTLVKTLEFGQGTNITAKERDYSKTLTEQSNWSSKNINIFLDPPVHMENININNNNYTENKWQSSFHNMSIFTFIKECHSHIKNSDGMLKRNLDESFRSILNELKRPSPLGFDPLSHAKEWLNIIFSEKNKTNGHNIDFYFDLVELASALDHITDEKE